MKVLFFGDICICNSLTGFSISESLAELLKTVDSTVANWEAAIVNDANYLPIKKAGPTIKQHSDYELLLRAQNFSYVSLANNHIMDYGKQGLQNTIQVLESSGIKCFGAGLSVEQAYKPMIIEDQGLRVGLISVGEAQFGTIKYEDAPGYAWACHPTLTSIIAKTKQQVDFLLMLPHAGLEMVDLPLPEWRQIYRSWIDCGADLVIGSHPHVIQGKESYKGSTIYYSLGNYLFNDYRQESSKWWNSLGLVVEFSKAKLNVIEHFISFDPEVSELSLNKKNLKKFRELCLPLKGTNEADFLEAINQICVQKWHEYYEKYYAYGFPKNSRIEKSRFKHFFFNRLVKKGSKLMLYHNINIETHRFVVERALRKILEIS